MSENKNLATTYNPKDFEERIYKNWEEKAKKFIKCSHKY